MERNDITTRLASVRERIAQAAARAGRATREIRILAVTKAHGKDLVHAALKAGLTDLGENYVQEGIAKMEETGPGTRWHFIGRVQSNKTRAIGPSLRLGPHADARAYRPAAQCPAPGGITAVKRLHTGPHAGSRRPSGVARRRSSRPCGADRRAAAPAPARPHGHADARRAPSRLRAPSLSFR